MSARGTLILVLAIVVIISCFGESRPSTRRGQDVHKLGNSEKETISILTEPVLLRDKRALVVRVGKVGFMNNGSGWRRHYRNGRAYGFDGRRYRQRGLIDFG
ncbi:unnamed protein product [Orchesella dallaii]